MRIATIFIVERSTKNIYLMVMAHIFLPTVAVSLLDTLRMANKMEKAYSIQIYKIKKLKFMRVNGKME